MGLALILLMGCPGDPQDSGDTDPPEPIAYDDPLECAGCHPVQAEEWRGSLMHYSATSPTFNAFELVMNDLGGGAFRHDGDQPGPCAQCHAPVGVAQGQIDTDHTAPLRDGLGEVAKQGLSCDSYGLTGSQPPPTLVEGLWCSASRDRGRRTRPGASTTSHSHIRGLRLEGRRADMPVLRRGVRCLLAWVDLTAAT